MINQLLKNQKSTNSLFRLSSLILLTICLFTGNLFAQIDVTATGGATPSPASYSTLKAAFDQINSGGHTGIITIGVSGNTTETAPASLNASGSGLSLYTGITISPTGGAGRTITGAISAGSSLVDLNGADNVSINGLNSGGNSLTFSNTTVSATSGTSTIQFRADASNNTITNCSILGSATMAVGANGGNIFFGSGAISTGNDGNTISFCDIGPAGTNLPSKGIYFSGTSNTNPGTANSGIIIDNNNIFNCFSATVSSAAIDVNSGTTHLTISNNRIYQTATRTMTTASLTHSGIRINNTAGNAYSISGNTIGFANNIGSGSYTLVLTNTSTFMPINLSVGTGTVSSVQGNTINGIAMSGTSSGTSSSAAFRGIYVGSGLTTIGDVSGNTIGSLSSTGTITYTSSSASASDMIGIFNFGSSNWTTNNNNVGGFTGSNSSSGAVNVYGIRCNTGSGVTWTCNGNIVGGTIANSMQSTTTSTGTTVVGILNSNPIGTFTSNIVRNLTAAGGTGTTTAASVIGISATNTVNNTFSQNTIHTLTNTNASAATVVTGIQFNGGAANIVERNTIYGLTSSTTSASAEINGIRVAGGTTTYRNNMITLGAGVTNSPVISGINEAGGTNNIWHNSIYVGGTPSAGTANSFAFNSVVTTNTRSFRNNIFVNNRSNSGATAKHYAVRVGGTAANPAGLTINNNIYHGTGTGFVFGLFNSVDRADLAAWQSAVGQDAGSYFSNPQFIDPTNSVPDLHIHATNPTLAETVGAALGVVLDFDGETRSGLTPNDIGADAGNFVAPCFTNGTLTPSGPTTFCVGSSVDLTAACTSNCGTSQSYSWSPATGLSATTGATVTANPTVTTTYVVTFSSDAGCEAGTASVTITVNKNPILYASNVTPLAICSGEGATLTASAGTTSNYSVQSTTYNFETPSGVRTNLPTFSPNNDDGVSASITLPFTFNYFGADMTNVFAYSNGFVQLGTSSGSTTSYGAALPAAGAPNNIIAGIWDDLNVTGGGVVSHFTNGVAPNRVFIIEYNAVKFFNSTSNGNITFQIKLFEDGRIEIHYNNVVDPEPSNHFSGIENSGGTIGVPITGRNPFTTDITTSEAWLFMPSGAGNTYAWSPATYLSDAAIANPTATNITSDVSYTLTVTAANGCTVTSPTYDIVVTSGAAITAEPAPLSRCTGQSASFTVGATGPGLTYQWYLDGNPLADGGSISGATAATLTVSNLTLADAGTYEVEVFATCGGAVGSDGSSVLTINQTPSASAGSSASVCAGDDINLVGTSDIGTTFSWTGPNGFTSSTLTDNITSVTALNSGTYAFTASTASCTSVTSNVVMTVNTPQTVAYASQASASTVCPAGNVDLTTSITAPRSMQIGSGVTSNATGTAVGAFYGTYWGNGHAQILYTAAELTAAGLVAGNITSLAVNTSGSVGDPSSLTNFTIKMAHTGVGAITTFQAPTFTTVWNAASYSPSIGLNTHTFSTPFNWDGTSNVIIDYCFANSVTGNTSFVNTMTTTGFGSFVNYNADGAGGAGACATTTVSNTSSNRPNLIFTGNSNLSTASITWNDGTSDVGTGTPLNISVPSTTSYTMTALGTDGCSYVDPTPVTVTTLSGATITAEPVALNRCTSESATFTVAATGPGLTYQWYQDGNPLVDGGRISGATTASLTISNLDVLDAGVYEVEITATCGAPAASDGSSTLTINQKPTASAGSNFAVCEGNTINLVGTSDIGTTFTWAGPNGFTSSSLTDNIPSAAAINAGTYTFTASTVSCTSNPSTVTVTVNAPSTGINFNSVADANPVCPGGSVNLSTSLSKSVNVTLGSGATPSNAAAISPYRVAYGGYKSQYIIRQSELVALGLTAGNITSLGMNVTTLGDPTFSNFSISLAHTAQTVAVTNTAITSGLTSVYANASQSVTSGVNTYNFSTPFAWDGTSNIVVSINFTNNNSGGTTSTSISSDNVGFVSSLSIGADNATEVCLLSAVSSAAGCFIDFTTNATSSSRPRFFITGNGTPSIASYTWNDGLTDVGTGNPSNIVVPSTTSYTVTALGTDGCSYTDPSVVTVNTSTGAVMVTEPIASAKCSGETATFAVVATGAGLTYQWYQDGAPLADGGRISGATSATLTITSTVTADAGIYEVEITPACGAPITSDGSSVLTMTQTPTANAGAPISICVGSDINLVGTFDVGTTFTWTGPNGFTSAIASPSITSAAANASGVYTFTTVNGTCSSPASTVNVAVNANPASVVATSSVPDVCLASTFNLGVTASTAPVALINETFEGGLGSFTAVNNSTGGTPANAAWTVQSNSYNTGGSWGVAVSSNNASNFVLSNSDSQGNSSTTATLLTSQSFSTFGYSGLNLSFYHHFRVSPGTALVQVSEDGISYTTVRTFTTTQGAPTGFVQVNVNLDAYLNKPTLYVRFKYDAAWGYGWAIDNVSVTGSSTYTYAWASDPIGYTSTTQNPTGLTQAATTEYIATVTNSGTGCFASNSIVVNTLPELTPSVTISSDDVDNIISPNTLVTYTATPVNGGSTPSYQWKLNGGNVGTNSATYTNSTLSNNDVVSCVMTSNYLCLSTPTATSNNVTMTVNNQLTQIVVVQCGITLVDNSTDIYCNAISGASIYEFRLFNPLTGTTLTIQKPSRTFKPAQVAGCLPGVTYEVSARAFYNFAWSDFGPACNITTKSAAGLTKLQTSQCGITLTNVATDLYANSIISATQYKFKVTNGASVQEITKTSRTFKMSQLATVHYGATVTVEVDAFVNGAWIGYGPSCNVTMPALPTAKLQASQCGITLTSTTTLLYSDLISGATQYRFRVKNATLTFADSIVKASRVFKMSEIPGLVVNTTYQVDVAVYYNGAWQNYGAVCNVTTPAALAMMIQEDFTAENNYSELNDSKELEIIEEEQLISETINSELLFVELSAYPNPNNGEFTISSTHEGSFRIINELGQLVQVVEITKENNLQTKVEVIAKGVYFVTGIVGGEVVTSKIVVQ
jgi:hypothetical protein